MKRRSSKKFGISTLPPSAQQTGMAWAMEKDTSGRCRQLGALIGKERRAACADFMLPCTT
jgi:hypothetical protein